MRTRSDFDAMAAACCISLGFMGLLLVTRLSTINSVRVYIRIRIS
jgi:hypothetical protein